MGLSHEQHAERLKGLQPTIHETPDPKPDVVTEDPTIGNEEHIRGLPAVGRVSGTMKGTRPGDSARALEDEARELNEHARRLVKQQMQAARKRLGPRT